MRKLGKKAFTLIELIVVVAVIGILVLLGAPRFTSYIQKAELTKIQHDVKVMENEMGILMLENEVDIGYWGNNNKSFNQLIVEDKLFEKEGVAEKVYTEHLTRNGVLNLSKYFIEVVTSSKTASLSDDKLGIGGELYPVNELPEDFSVDKTYKVIPEEYSKKIKTKLDGTFYVNSDGKVYYEHEKPIPGEDKDKTLTCPTALPDYEFEHETGTIVKWHGTEQYLTIPSHFLVDGECWPVRIIGVGAFANGDFRKVVIPDTVVKIERDAFKDSVIGEIVIPHSVVNIADGAFSGGGIVKVEVIGEPGRFEPGVFVDTDPTFRRPTPQELGIVIHPESGTIVSSTRPFNPNINNANNSQSGNTGAVGGTLIIPEQVEVPGRDEPVRIEKIHKGAFQGQGLIEVHMPSTLKRIEAYAFAGNQLNWVEIPQSVEYIGEYAFAFNQHIHSKSNKVRPTIKSIKINDIERVNNVESGNIVDSSGNLISPLDGVEMKEYIWVTDAENFKFEEIDPEEPVNPDPEEPVNPDPEEPVNPGPEEPVNPGPEEPVNPDPEEPVNPDPEEPGESGEPGEPGEKEPVYSNEEIQGLITEGYIPIATAEELNNVRNATTVTYGEGTEWKGEYKGGLDKKYVQVANIDLSRYSGGEGWAPIGNSSSEKFEGSFDGNGYKITSLTINRPETDNVGLFGYTEESTISNVSLEGINVIGKDNVGGLVGNATHAWAGSTALGTTINNSYSTGSVIGTGSGSRRGTGGLMGHTTYSNISNSYSTASVESEDSSGGLVGRALSFTTINNSYATGSVRSSGDYAGGISGYINHSTEISKSYATGEVTGWYAGGIAGYAHNTSKISNSYATGSVTGSAEKPEGRLGGLVGSAYGVSISNSYATGKVTVPGSGAFAGGLVGEFTNKSSITDSYWNKNTTTQSKIAGAGNTNTTPGKTTEEMKNQATYKYWKFDTVWKIDEGVSYPTLR